MRSRLVPGFLLGILALLFACAASPAFAFGQICGTVRDASTANPVAGAGVFVLTTAGAYAGFNATSDAAGTFCINGIPAGTYDLEIRREHYLTRFVRGVIVQDLTGVDVGLAPFAGMLFPPSPNPARSSVQLRFRLPDAARVRLEVLDSQGRVLKGWSDPSAAAGDHVQVWDFHDHHGRNLPAGAYFLRLDVNGSTTTRVFSRVP